MSNIEQDCVTFRMRDEDGNELHFKVSMGIRLQKVFDVYASKKNLTVSSLKFMFSSERVIGDMSPESLGTYTHTVTDHPFNSLFSHTNSVPQYLPLPSHPSRPSHPPKVSRTMTSSMRCLAPPPSRSLL